MKFLNKGNVILTGLGALLSSAAYAQNSNDLEKAAADHNGTVIWVDEGTKLYQAASTIVRQSDYSATQDFRITKGELIITSLCDDEGLRHNVSQMNNDIADLTATVADEAQMPDLAAAMRLDNVMVQIKDGTTCGIDVQYEVVQQRDGLRGDGFASMHAQNGLVPIVVPNAYFSSTAFGSHLPSNDGSYQNAGNQNNGEGSHNDNNGQGQNNGSNGVGLSGLDIVVDNKNRVQCSGGSGNSSDPSVEPSTAGSTITASPDGRVTVRVTNSNDIDCTSASGQAQGSVPQQVAPAPVPTEAPTLYNAYTRGFVGLGAHYISEGGQAPLTGWGGWLEGRLEIPLAEQDTFAVDARHLWVSKLTYTDDNANQVFVVDGDVSAGFVVPLSKVVRFQFSGNVDGQDAQLTYAGMSGQTARWAVGPQFAFLGESDHASLDARFTYGWGKNTTNADVAGFVATDDPVEKAKAELTVGYTPLSWLGFRALGSFEHDSLDATTQGGALLPQNDTLVTVGARADVLKWLILGADLVPYNSELGNDTLSYRLQGGLYHEF